MWPMADLPTTLWPSGGPGYNRGRHLRSDRHVRGRLPACGAGPPRRRRPPPRLRRLAGRARPVGPGRVYPRAVRTRPPAAGRRALLRAGPARARTAGLPRQGLGRAGAAPGEALALPPRLRRGRDAARDRVPAPGRRAGPRHATARGPPAGVDRRPARRPGGRPRTRSPAGPGTELPADHGPGPGPAAGFAAPGEAPVARPARHGLLQPGGTAAAEPLRELAAAAGARCRPAPRPDGGRQAGPRPGVARGLPADAARPALRRDAGVRRVRGGQRAPPGG